MKKTLQLTLLFLVLSISANAQVFNEQSLKFARLLDWVNNYYVDTVNQKQLVETAIVEMLRKLDPHSAYISKEEMQEANEPLVGNFEGIGVSFNILHDTIMIISPIPGGPSERLGIMSGDKIIKIDGVLVAGKGITNKEVFKKLRGAKGTKVNIEIKRKSSNALIPYTIVRAKIPIYCIDAAYMIEPGIGYIRLARFSANTTAEFETALAKLQAQNMKHLVLDLSGNGGGYLEEAINLADEFLEKGQLIVYTEGRSNPRQDFIATERGMLEKGRLAVVIDEGSASASEIVSGAIQDWDRGVIVGRRSFGKGLVQRGVPLNDGSMVRLTIARYHTPTGRVIQKPYSQGYDAYEKDILDRYKNGEFVNKDSIRFPDSLKYYTLKKKKLVYGGGGIMPDVFVPLDTTAFPMYVRNAIRLGTLYQFVVQYVDEHRAELKSTYPDFESYKTKFVVEGQFRDAYVQYAVKQDSTLKPDNDPRNLAELDMLLKAYLARNIWDSNEFFQIYNLRDNAVLKATEVIRNWKDYQK
jgi:carboxyl-terminal processing protease